MWPWMKVGGEGLSGGLAACGPVCGQLAVNNKPELQQKTPQQAAWAK